MKSPTDPLVMRIKQLLTTCLLVVVFVHVHACGGRTSLGNLHQSGVFDSGAGGQGAIGSGGSTGGDKDAGGDDAGSTPDSAAPDGRDTAKPLPRIPGGTVAWTHQGHPKLDQTGALQLSGGGYMGTERKLWQVDKTSGEEIWEVEFVGDSCQAKSRIIVFDRDLKTISSRSQTDGSRLWSMDSQAVVSLACGEQSGRFFTIEERELGGSTINAHTIDDGSLSWQSVLEKSASYGILLGQTYYVIWSPGDNQSNLQALNVVDGKTRWLAAFSAGSIQFDVQENVFVVHDSDGNESLSRIDTSTGSLAWNYRPDAGSITLLLENSADFLGIGAGDQLVALDKATGRKLWTYDANPGGNSKSWQASFTKSGNALFVVRDSAKTVVIGRDGRELWSILAPLFEPQADEFYDVEAGVVSRHDPATGDTLWTFKDSAGVGGISEIVGSHGDQVFFAGKFSSKQDGYAILRTVLGVSKADGRLLWQSEKEVVGSVSTADEECIYLSSGALAKYDTYGITTAVGIGMP
jgi:outer membrane protein assembly factor BamB